MGKADYLKLGDHNVICDVCGRKRKSSHVRKTWDGFWVCPQHWEPRHTQDFVRGVKDNQSVEFSRPTVEAEDRTYIDTTPQTSETVPAGSFTVQTEF